MCAKCAKDHKDYNQEWIQGSNEKIYELFNQDLLLLTERKDQLVDLIQIIKEKMNSTQITQDKILEVAHELKKFTEQAFIDPKKLELTKYLLNQPVQPLVLINQAVQPLAPTFQLYKTYANLDCLKVPPR